ncbi:MAG: hypothetical protein ACKO0Z_06885 [Betaproteobacteria bacterium]
MSYKLADPKTLQLYDGPTGAALAWLASQQVTDSKYRGELQATLLESFKSLSTRDLSRTVLALDQLTGDYSGETALALVRRIAGDAA